MDPTAAPNPTTPETRRFSIRLPRPLWFGLLAGVILLTVVGFQFGLPIWRQQVAIREIERVHGWFEARERGPNWVRRFVGVERMKGFDEVWFVNLNAASNIQSGMAQLERLPSLEYVDLTRSKVTDAELIHLTGLTRLDTLWLIDTQISDHGLRLLTPVLPRLKVLYLNGTSITDEGMMYLRNLARVEDLSLGNTIITDAGLTHLEGLAGLQRLGLMHTKVTDAGLKHLRGMSDLRVLSIHHTEVSDQGLAELQYLTRLEKLEVQDTKVTGEGVAQLKQALPRLEFDIYEARSR